MWELLKDAIQLLTDSSWTGYLAAEISGWIANRSGSEERATADKNRHTAAPAHSYPSCHPYSISFSIFFLLQISSHTHNLDYICNLVMCDSSLAECKPQHLHCSTRTTWQKVVRFEQCSSLTTLNVGKSDRGHWAAESLSDITGGSLSDSMQLPMKPQKSLYHFFHTCSSSQSQFNEQKQQHNSMHSLFFYANGVSQA